MNDSNRQEFAEVVLGFAELKGKELSKPAIRLYWEALKDWDIRSFKTAAAHLLKTCEFMPTPKDFEDLKRAAMPSAGEAWMKALEHARGAWRYGPIGDPAIDKAVRMLGGYQRIAMCEESKTHFLEKRFLEHYADMQESAEVSGILPQLNGAPMLETE